MSLQTTPTSTRRLAGPDVVRAVALIGVVVMNFHGYLLLRREGIVGDGWADRLFDPWEGILSTRFAVTFVLVAGVGVTLMTRRSVAERRAGTGTGIGVAELRWRLVRRGLVLYVVGLLLDEIWPGTILPYYGVMFMLSAGMFTWRTRTLAGVGGIAALAGAALRMWRFERHADGFSTAWLTDPDAGSLRDHVFGVFVNGTHPLLPWFGFFCAGMILGRLLATAWWRTAAIASGFGLVAVAWAGAAAATSTRLDVALSTAPYDRGLLYVTSSLGTALAFYGVIDWCAERYPERTDPLRRAGQMTLSLYIAHVFVFNLIVDWLHWIEPAGVGTALGFALGFWIVGIAAAVAWQRRFGMGPAERIYRAVGG